MEDTLKGAVQGIDVPDVVALYAEGQRNAQGFSDDPRYREQLAWFETVHSIEPRAWLYSYVLEEVNRPATVDPSIDPPTDRNATNDQGYQIRYLVDLWANYDSSKAAKFRDVASPAGTMAQRAVLEGRLMSEPEIYTDRWGTWLSAFVPIRDEDGQIVGGLGLDIEANYVFEVQQAIRNRVLLSFSITYGVLFVLIYILSGVLTRHLAEFTNSAERIGIGNYDLPLSLMKKSLFPDEMDRLAQVFQTMVENIRTREQIIRESKRIEDEIRHALQEEKEINELKSRFVSMVSHELRTPLTIIRTSTELLEQYGQQISEEKKQQYFQRVHTAVRNMTQMLEDVLTFGRAEAGRLDFHPVSINLETFCCEILEEIRMDVGHNYTVVFNSRGSCAKTYLDPVLTRSILTNLLSNAIKYSPKGSNVELNLSCQNGFATIEIRDYGIGIPAEDQARLFELFHRASNTSTIRGTGIGLAIVKQCVAHHQGKIWFKSVEGKGTTFIIQLPISDSP